MPGDGSDSEDIFIMGPGVAAHHSMFSSNRGKGVGYVSGSDDSLDMDAANSLADTVKKRRGPGRPVNALKKGKVGKDKARKRAEKRKAKKAESVFVVDDVEVDSDDCEEGQGNSLGDSGLQSTNDAEDAVIAVVDLDSDDPVAEVRRPSNRRTRKRPRRVTFTDGSESDVEPGANAQQETELERRLRESIAAARSAAEEFLDDEVAAEAKAEEQRVHEAAVAAAAAAAEEKAIQDRLKRAAARDTDTGVVVLRVRCLGSSKAPLVVKLREEHILARLKAGVCKKFQTQSNHSVLFYQGNVLSERETIAYLGIVNESELELRISPDPVVSLKVRYEGEIVIPDIRVREEDPIVCIRHIVCLKTGLDRGALSLHLDGEALEETETCKELDVASDTLVEALKIKSK